VIAAATGAIHAAIAACAPPGVEVRVAGDGELDGVEFLVLHHGGMLDVLPTLRDLRVVQVLSAGTDWIEPRVPRWATLCNARGARDVPMAEWVVGALLGAASGLLAGARRSTWVDAESDELHGSRVVILGHGSIGEAVRARLEPFGVEVIGVGRAQLDELPALLPMADAVVVLAPLTGRTRGMVDAQLLGRMRDGALLVNAGRGAVVDTDALVAELRAGRLRAVLDVVDPEPLPDGHPLWDLALTITPHHAGDSKAADARATRLAAEQLGRYARGEELLNVVLAAGR
jgi:phosphoglycerate dehydrogenase-like enzyme